MRNVGSILLISLLGCSLTQCGGDDRDRRRSRSFSGAGGGADAQLKTVDMATAGTVSGKVTFEGEAPRMKPIQMQADPKCGSVHTDTVSYEEVVVNADGTLANCFVFIEVPDEYTVPSTPATLDQVGCIYRPHVIGMQVGQDFEIKNSDETLHNIHWISRENGEQNFGMPRPGTKNKKFEYPEVGVRVKCDVHPWMGGWIHVMTHPFHAVTGADGTFTIQGVPPGTYDAVLWHEKYDSQRVQVTVATGQTATADFTVKAN
jgi:plastocyanin